MNKTIRRGNCGVINKDKTGYLKIGLTQHQVKLKRVPQVDNDEKIKLQLVHKNNNKRILDLFQQTTTNGKIYYSGNLDIGFGVMNISIFQFDGEIKSDYQANWLMTMRGKLIMQNIETNNSTNNEDDYDVDEIFNNKRESSHITTSQGDRIPVETQTVPANGYYSSGGHTVHQNTDIIVDDDEIPF